MKVLLGSLFSAKIFRKSLGFGLRSSSSFRNGLFALLSFTLVSCTPKVVNTTSSTERALPSGVVTPQSSGTLEYIWEEPMVDVVDVPPGLDPEGHYYRPGHQEVVEIRQGRWKYLREKK